MHTHKTYKLTIKLDINRDIDISTNNNRDIDI